jgi:nucleoside-triphosphatase THEP1
MTVAMTSASYSKRPLVIVVTGAQGVGKSTFCKKLHSAILNDRGGSVSLVEGLGEKIKAAGFAVGKTADTQGVAAVFAEHLRRERLLDGNVAILDRCAIDALAYVRTLGVNTVTEAGMYAELTRLMSTRWDMVVHLQLSKTFINNSAAHEDAELRQQISIAIPAIIHEFGLQSYAIDAAANDSIDRIVKAVAAAAAL